MTCPLESRVFSSETLVAGANMIETDQRQLHEVSEDGLQEELNRLKAIWGIIVFQCCMHV